MRFKYFTYVLLPVLLQDVLLSISFLVRLRGLAASFLLPAAHEVIRMQNQLSDCEQAAKTQETVQLARLASEALHLPLFDPLPDLSNARRA